MQLFNTGFKLSYSSHIPKLPIALDNYNYISAPIGGHLVRRAVIGRHRSGTGLRPLIGGLLLRFDRKLSVLPAALNRERQQL